MNKEILKLAIPNIISNVSVPLLSTVDTALMGRLSDLHIGAVGLGAMIFNFIFWNFGFLRMGTTGITAQAYGSNKEADMIHALLRALSIGLGIAVLIVLTQWLIGETAFYWMNVSEEQLPLVSNYFYIRIWAAPASLGLFALMGWFFGMQNAIYPLLITILVNGVNIVLNFFFVHQLNMAEAGVAWSTVIAQYVGFFTAIGLVFFRYRSLFTAINTTVVWAKAELQTFLSINGDIFIRTIFLTLAFAMFYSYSSEAGATVLAANVILLQLVNWMSYGVDGFSFAAESLVGKYRGANDLPNTHKAIRISFLWGMGLAVLFSLLYGLFGTAILQIYTDQKSVLQASSPYLFWMILFPILATPCYLWDGIFIGLTASKSMRNSMLIAFTVFVASLLLFSSHLSNHGLWLSLMLFMVFRGLIQQLMFWRKGVQVT